MKKYIKRDCNYWGHLFIPLGIDNEAINGGRIRFCQRCQKHFITRKKGILYEEVIDLIDTTLKDFPR